MDADGQRERALAYLGGYLHEFRIHRLCEIQFLLAKTLGLLSLHGLTIEKHRHPESAISPPESQKQTNEKVDRDIPTENEPIRGDLQELLRLWQLGYTAKEIASRIGRTEKTILNRLTLLRKAYGEQIVPRRRTI
jgi:DNA-directed RNA polymerase specialized sigma24 family protein